MPVNMVQWWYSHGEQTVSYFQDYIETHNIYSGNDVKGKRHEEFLTWVMEQTAFLDDTPKLAPIGVRLYCIEAGITEIPKCENPDCDKIVNTLAFDKESEFRFKRRFSKFCCYKCAASSKETKRLREETVQRKYGVSHVSKVPEVTEKRAATCVERYGAKNWMQNPENKKAHEDALEQSIGVRYPMQAESSKKRRINTYKERYGVDHWMKDPLNVKKLQEIFIEKYGVTSPSSNPEVKEKIKATNKERYGVEWFPMTENFFENSRKVLIKKYGNDHPMRIHEFKNKVAGTTKKRHGGRFPAHNYVSEQSYGILNDKEKLAELYDECVFMSVVGERLGVDKSTVQRYMAYHEIPTNPVHKGSISELEVAEFVESLGVETIRNDRTILNPYESDIVVPDRKLIIEYNGVYWHSEQYKPKKYHQEKSLAAHQAGYQMIHVWEDDWMDDHKRQIVKSKIKSKLGLSDSKVYARNTVIGVPTKQEVRDLMDDHHIQGFVGYTHAYGLYEGDDLVACLTLRKTKTVGVYDLNRFATSKTVVGGMSKLISHVKKVLDFKEIFTYAHLDYSSGGVYEKCGFSKTHITPPGLWYVVRGSFERLRRERFMKHKLPRIFGLDVDMNKTESEIMADHGYYRVFDAGSIKYSLTP